MPIGPARMPLFDHLGELRMRLVRIVVSLFIAMCVFYMATPTIIQFMCLPVADYLPKGDDGLVVLNVLDVFGSFTIRFKGCAVGVGCRMHAYYSVADSRVLPAGLEA